MHRSSFATAQIAALIMVSSYAPAKAQTANELAQLPGSTSLFAEHGQSVAVDGDTAIVGAPAAPGGGEARIFRKTNGVWNQEAVLSSSGTLDFGRAVGVSGDTAVVGAPLTNSARGQVEAYF